MNNASEHAFHDLRLRLLNLSSRLLSWDLDAIAGAILVDERGMPHPKLAVPEPIAELFARSLKEGDIPLPLALSDAPKLMKRIRKPLFATTSQRLVSAVETFVDPDFRYAVQQQGFLGCRWIWPEDTAEGAVTMLLEVLSPDPSTTPFPPFMWPEEIPRQEVADWVSRAREDRDGIPAVLVDRVITDPEPWRESWCGADGVEVSVTASDLLLLYVVEKAAQNVADQLAVESPPG